MAEKVREKTKCRSCGVVVRDGAVFCFNCGESTKAKNTQEISAPDLGDINNGHPVAHAASKVGEEHADSEESAVSKLNEGRSGLRSAASMRGKVKAYNRKPVEVEWVAPEKPPAAYIIVSILLVAFAALMLFLAWYLK